MYQDELAAHAKFQDPRTTPSGRKVNTGREEKEGRGESGHYVRSAKPKDRARTLLGPKV